MKFNKKQKKIMRFGAIILFCVALVLILNLIFNNGGNKKYVGTWFIGYKMYQGNNKDSMIYMFTQEMHLNNDLTFYTYEREKQAGNRSAVSGTYEIDGDTIILKYKQNGYEKKTNLYYVDGKLCTDGVCDRYYTKGKIKKYFEEFNVNFKSSEE